MCVHVNDTQVKNKELWKGNYRQRDCQFGNKKEQIMNYIVEDRHHKQFASNQTLVVQKVCNKREEGDVGGPLSDVCVCVCV